MSARRWLIPLIFASALAIPAAGAASSAGPTVKVADAAFKPKSISVSHGTKVSWHWVGLLMHNVWFVSGPKGAKKFHSKTGVGLNYSHVFTTKGKYLLV